MNSITSSAGSLISWSVGGCNGSQTQEQHRRTRKDGQRHRHRYKRTSGKFTQAHREPHAHGPEKLLKPPVGITQSVCALRRRA